MTKPKNASEYYAKQDQAYSKSDFKKRIDKIYTNLELVDTKEKLLDFFAFAVEERQKDKDLQDIIATEVFRLVMKLQGNNMKFDRAAQLWKITLQFGYLDHLTNMPRELAPFDDEEFWRRYNDTEHEWQLTNELIAQEKSRKTGL